MSRRTPRYVHKLYPPPGKLRLGANQHTLEEHDDEPCVVVQLTQDVRALVDPADWLYLAAYRWCAALHGNRRKRWVMIARSRGDVLVLAHRLVAIEAGVVAAVEDRGASAVLVDHIHHPDLDARLIDNRRCNLRPATGSENGANTRPRTLASVTSRFRGVSWRAEKGRWVAQCAGQHVGYFDDECEAARAYDAAALATYGDFARLNFAAGAAPVPF